MYPYMSVRTPTQKATLQDNVFFIITSINKIVNNNRYRTYTHTQSEQIIARQIYYFPLTSDYDVNKHIFGIIECVCNKEAISAVNSTLPIV